MNIDFTYARSSLVAAHHFLPALDRRSAWQPPI